MRHDPQQVMWGAAAQRKGFPRTSCPVQTEPDRSAWLAGWDEAQNRSRAPWPVAQTAEVTAALDAAERVLRMLVPDDARLTKSQRGIKAEAVQAIADARDAVDVIEAMAAVRAADETREGPGGAEVKAAPAHPAPIRLLGLADELIPLPTPRPKADRPAPALTWPWINRPRPGVATVRRTVR